ncbi:MAG: AAA family ATPase [Fimbriimonas sp.]
MSKEVTSLIAEALAQPKDAVMYCLSERLAAAFPDRYVLETGEQAFDVPRFASVEECALQARPAPHSEFDARHWAAHASVYRLPHNAWQSLTWEGVEFDLITVGIQGHFCREIRRYLIAPDRETAERFFLHVCEWNLEVRGEVLVYHDGWDRDEDLLNAIEGSTLDNLVLEDGLKERVRADVEGFFRARETYEKYGIPWKRGVLFLGPPGNGKTHMIKALVNLLEIPALYVRSFERERGTEQSAMQEVFQRARKSAPCLLILEDLDALLNDENRSFFLNELDGFAANTGVMVVGTTNHPERLDPAILERPSRFDRKVTFHLPSEEGREGFLRQFRETLEPALRLTDGELGEVVRLTDDFSYAYLKELYLSAMMAWIAAEGTRPVGEVMREQVDMLRQQMQTAAEEPSMTPGASRTQRSMQRWRKTMQRQMRM